MTLDTFTETSPIVVGQPTKRSDVNKVYANSFYLREMIEPQVTGGETVSVGEVCYVAETTDGGNTVGRAYKTDSDNAYSSNNPAIIGVCSVAFTSGTVGRIRRLGIVEGLAGLTVGARYYISATPGALTATPSTVAVLVGIGLTTTSILLMPWGWQHQSLKTPMANAPTGTGALVLAAAPHFTVVPTFTPGAGADPATINGTIYSSSFNIDSDNSGLQALLTLTLAANTLNADGKGLRITMFGTSANNANAKFVGLYFGSTISVGGNIGSGHTNWNLTVTVLRSGAASQVMTAIGGSSSGASPSDGTCWTPYATPGETCSGGISISAGCNTTVAADVTLKGFIIETLR